MPFIKLFTRLCPFLFAIVVMASSCSNHSTNASRDDNQDSADSASLAIFATDSLHWQDSIIMGNCHAKVQIDVTYPAGEASPLVNNVRRWIGRQLFSVMISDSAKVRNMKPQPDGAKLIAEAGEYYLNLADADFEEFDSTFVDYPIDYEYSFSMAPDFISSKQLTYSSLTYIYTAGAHGSTLACGQTFARNDGTPLTTANTFRKESLKDLTALVRQEIFNQYFKPQLEESSSSTNLTLEDCLLIPVKQMGLPANPPYFTPEGIAFLYGQYEIAPYAAGMPTCTIPYSQIRPFLTPLAASLLP